jgi:hypothetical protein
MKKSVLLMAGLMAVALAGSAQAATTMFAVQDAAATDKMVVTDTGWIGIGTAVPTAPFHVMTAGNATTNAAFLYQFTNNGTLSAVKAPNFYFSRNNDPAATGTKNPNDATLPRADDNLGILQFGTVVGTGRNTMASITTKAEGDPTTIVQPGYMIFSTQHNNAGALAFTEKLRITSLGNILIPAVTTNINGGNLGIGTTTPTSKLQVVGLPVFADNAAALVGGLTAGAFYRTATGVLMVAF